MRRLIRQLDAWVRAFGDGRLYLAERSATRHRTSRSRRLGPSRPPADRLRVATAPQVVRFSERHLDSIRPMGATLSDKAFRAAVQLVSSMPSAWRR